MSGLALRLAVVGRFRLMCPWPCAVEPRWRQSNRDKSADRIPEKKENVNFA